MMRSRRSPGPGTPEPPVSPAHMEELLRPFLPQPLQVSQLAALATYLGLLLRWNARLNLTAVREANNIVTRHMGESLFAAAYLLSGNGHTGRTIDLGSGAGFPGLPFKIYAPHLRVTLIESQHKKATFLREVVRALQLAEVEVFAGRGENFGGRGQLVVLRAVERFEQALPIAASLLDSSSEGAFRPTPAPIGTVDRRRTSRTGASPPAAIPLGGAHRDSASPPPAFSWWDLQPYKYRFTIH